MMPSMVDDHLPLIMEIGMAGYGGTTQFAF